MYRRNPNHNLLMILDLDGIAMSISVLVLNFVQHQNLFALSTNFVLLCKVSSFDFHFEDNDCNFFSSRSVKYSNFGVLFFGIHACFSCSTFS